METLTSEGQNGTIPKIFTKKDQDNLISIMAKYANTFPGIRFRKRPLKLITIVFV